MATGYESYVTIMYTQPTAALAAAQNHLMALMQQQGPRVGSDGTQYDPAALDAAIALTERHIRYLIGVAQHIGQPRMVPTRRVDGGPVMGQGSTSYG